MSLFLTHHLELTPEKYIFGHIPSPFLNSYPISLLLCPCTCSSLVGSQRGHERLRPALPTAAGASPGPGSPPLLASPRTLHPLCLRHSLSQCSAQLGLGQMPAFLLALGPSALPLFLFPFVYGTQSSSQAMRKCSALGQVEFLSRKIAQEFRAGVRSQACWAGCFVLSAPVLLEDLLA